MRTILQARTHQGAKKVLTEAMHGAQTDAKPVFPHFLPLNLMKKRAAQGKLELLNVPLEEPTRPQQTASLGRRDRSCACPPTSIGVQ